MNILPHIISLTPTQVRCMLILGPRNVSKHNIFSFIHSVWHHFRLHGQGIRTPELWWCLGCGTWMVAPPPPQLQIYLFRVCPRGEALYYIPYVSPSMRRSATLITDIHIKQLLLLKWSTLNPIIVKPVTRGQLNKCPYMTGVPSSQVHFNVKVHFGSQKIQFRHPDRCPLITGFTVHHIYNTDLRLMTCSLFKATYIV